MLPYLDIFQQEKEKKSIYIYIHIKRIRGKFWNLVEIPVFEIMTLTDLKVKQYWEL